MQKEGWHGSALTPLPHGCTFAPGLLQSDSCPQIVRRCQGTNRTSCHGLCTCVNPQIAEPKLYVATAALPSTTRVYPRNRPSGFRRRRPLDRVRRLSVQDLDDVPGGLAPVLRELLVLGLQAEHALLLGLQRDRGLVLVVEDVYRLHLQRGEPVLRVLVRLGGEPPDDVNRP